MASQRSNWARCRASGSRPTTQVRPKSEWKPAVADAGVDPEHVALAQLALGREERAGEVTRRGPGPVGHPLGHHLPNGIEDVGVRSRLEDRAEKRGREVRLADTGGDAGLHVGNGALGDPERLAHAGQLVPRLRRLCLADDAPTVGGSTTGEENRLLTAEGVRPLVHGDHGVVRHESRQLRCEELHSLVEVEIDRAMQVISRQTGHELLVLPHRGEEVWPLVVDQRRGQRAARSSLGRNRPAARSRPWRRRRWCCRAAPMRPDPALAWRLASEPSVPCACGRGPASAGIDVGWRRSSVRPASGVHPEIALDVAADDRHGGLGPHRVDDLGQRLAAVAVRALVVREVG